MGGGGGGGGGVGGWGGGLGGGGGGGEWGHSKAHNIYILHLVCVSALSINFHVI